MRERQQSDDGYSMIELLIVMVIFSGLMLITYAVLATVQDQTSETQARADAVAESRLALAQMDRQVRSGNVLYNPADEALPNSMRVYTQANGDQRCVQWHVHQGSLRTRAWAPGNPASATEWRTVANHLANEEQGVSPFSLRGGGTTTTFGARVVDLVLLTRVATGDDETVEVRSSLSGRNTVYGYDAGTCGDVPPA